MAASVTNPAPSHTTEIKPPPAAPIAPAGIMQATPSDVHAWLRAGQAVLIDVREPDEHARERIPGSRLLPLSTFSPDRAAQFLAPGQKLVLHCKGGKRSTDACRLATMLTARGVPIVNMIGGIDAWKSAALPTDSSSAAPRISVMRQVQLTVGALLLLGSALAWFVHPAFIALPAFLGAGLAFAGATGTCALASLLSVMPWNRAPAPAACSTGSCS